MKKPTKENVIMMMIEFLPIAIILIVIVAGLYINSIEKDDNKSYSRNITPTLSK